MYNFKGNNNINTIWRYSRDSSDCRSFRLREVNLSAFQKMDSESDSFFSASGLRLFGTNYNKAAFREISKLSFLSLNCHFWGKITKMITMVHSQILTNSWFSGFCWKWSIRSWLFSWRILEIIYNLYNIRWIRNNPRIDPSYNFSHFLSKISI